MYIFRRLSLARGGGAVAPLASTYLISDYSMGHCPARQGKAGLGVARHGLAGQGKGKFVNG